MRQYNGFELEIQGPVALVRLDNPPAHTWTPSSLSALKDLIADLNSDSSIYSLVLRGKGEKFFSAGADLKLFAEGDKQVARDMAGKFGEAFETLAAFRGVSIAAINGYALGGGLECALACDLRIAAEHSVMGLPEAAVGLLPCAGGTQWLPWLVGEAWAKRMILCGERIDAQTALRIGLIQEVVPGEVIEQRALTIATSVARQSPTSVEACKKLIHRARCGSPQVALSAEREAFADLFDSANQKEGVQAFLSKRAPNWAT